MLLGVEGIPQCWRHNIHFMQDYFALMGDSLSKRISEEEENKSVIEECTAPKINWVKNKRQITYFRIYEEIKFADVETQEQSSDFRITIIK